MTNATELSAQAGEFGRVEYDRPEYPGVWVKFKTSGYPRKLRREWDAADPDATLEIVLRYVEAWGMVDVAGNLIALPPEAERKVALLDNAEDAITGWLVRSFARFWLSDLLSPRPNLSAPSPATS